VLDAPVDRPVRRWRSVKLVLHQLSLGRG
jgi:hypothetical protein